MFQSDLVWWECHCYSCRATPPARPLDASTRPPASAAGPHLLPQSAAKELSRKGGWENEHFEGFTLVRWEIPQPDGGDLDARQAERMPVSTAGWGSGWGSSFSALPNQRNPQDVALRTTLP